MSLRILHLTVTRELTPGQLNQLRYEVSVARELKKAEWTTLAFQVAASRDGFVRQLPWPFRPIFFRNFFAWIWLLRNARQYDYVICRHITFDPFVFLFARWLPNRVTVHHAKEVEELRLIRRNLKGRAASILERWSGRTAVRHAAAVLGVTEEIKDYELAIHGSGRSISASIYPNGILVDEVEPLGDERPYERIEIAFMCGKFSSWHGLDVLLDQFENPDVLAELNKPITLHLIGRLSSEQQEQVQKLQEIGGPHRVDAYGLMGPQAYRPLLERCHVGLSSLALKRKGLAEAATLKVREMLAVGLPVYSGHRDTALPKDFPWYCIGKGKLLDIMRFAEKVSCASRQEVRDSSRSFIEKRVQMEKVVKFLSSLTNLNGRR